MIDTKHFLMTFHGYFHFQVEELAETELYYCNSCKCKQKSTKRFWIRHLPNVLCLHIKRFRWNNFFRTKIDLRIQFPIKSLDMSQYVLNNKTRSSTSVSSLYDLAAVIVHHGNGLVVSTFWEILCDNAIEIYNKNPISMNSQIKLRTLHIICNQ